MLSLNRDVIIIGTGQAGLGAAKNVYMVGDGAGISRGITGAWASGIRAAEGILRGS